MPRKQENLAIEFNANNIMQQITRFVVKVCLLFPRHRTSRHIWELVKDTNTSSFPLLGYLCQRDA